MKVDVWNGDQSVHLGLGEYVGDVEVFFIAMPDGSLRSLKNAEERPEDSLVPEGAHVFSAKNNPKIVLDDGQVVYGCQVWWQAVLSEQNLERIEQLCDEIKAKLDADPSLNLINMAADIVEKEFDSVFQFPVLDRVVKGVRKRSKS